MTLLERVKFLAIYCSNCGVLHGSAVAGVHDQGSMREEEGIERGGPDGMSPTEVWVIDGFAERVVDLGARH